MTPAGVDPSELAPRPPSGAQRDPVDAGRELEVLALLFRDDTMPADGVDILEGVASGCSWEEIATPPGIRESLTETRCRRMKAIDHRRMTKLGLSSNVTPRRAVVSTPGAITRLRGAA